ncbi:FimB/Mfa2 family fimbrial subunit [Mucilaginibacter agri]|uniref:Fimbrillin-A associated anchor protein Mfa1 and Mfa2 n=1 Tax=Mucilaginibacter agri TaxID=2695265 RepID=A0A965ZMD5_9SPHI|nr:FimB/Mfa2 family fimbrial subunit [Mucilaginibacter agri]NCD72257.1 hypothetical protein [Mucilaginibacter agri]
MKTNLTLLIVIAVALISCKKDNSMVVKDKPSPPVAVTKYPVSFSTSFSANSKPLGLKAINGVKKTQGTLKDYINFLKYYVTRIDSPGIIIKTVIQKSTDPDFGVIRDTLPKGNYRVVFLGETEGGTDVVPYSYDWEAPQSTWDLFAFNEAQSYIPPRPLGDIFVKVVKVTVSERAFTYIELERLTAKVDVVIQDPIPANVARIECREVFTDGYNLITNEDYKGSGSGFPYTTFVHQVLPSEIGTRYLTFYAMSFPQDGTQINLRAYDAAGKLLFDRYAADGGGYPVIANTELIFSGNMFDNPSTTIVGINPTWGNIKTVPFTDY